MVIFLGIIIPQYNECTKVQNPRRTGVRESLKAHALESLKTHALLKRTLITCNGKYTEDFLEEKRRLRERGLLPYIQSYSK